MTTQSVLDSMTAGIMDRKSGRSESKGLTPVAGELPAKAGIPDVPEVFLTNEAVADVARDLRAQATLLLQVADALDARTGVVTATVPPVRFIAESEARQKEREADERIRQIKATETTAAPSILPVYADLQKQAQDAVFAAVQPTMPARAGSVAPGWKCPTPGATYVEVKSSRKGREYRVCSRCPEFEK